MFNPDQPHPRSLRSRTLKSSGMVLAQMASQQVLRLVSNLIMTRLLVPEAFGLIAFVSALIAAFSLFSDIGIGKSIIRENDGDTPKFLHVAWVMKVIRGILIAIFVALAALLLEFFGTQIGAVGTVYANPVLPSLVLVSAVFPLMQGVESTTVGLAVRKLELGRITALEIITQIVAVFTMVGFAWLNPTVWALLAGMIVGQFTRTIASHLILPGPRMWLDWDLSIVLRIWHFGKWLLGASAFTFFARNADRLILAGLLNSTTFGIYTIARVWVDAGQLVIEQLANQVGFSSIGEVIRHSPEDAPRFFRKMQTIIDCLCVMGFLICFFGGTSFVALLYTDAYLPAGEKLRILGLMLLVARFDLLNQLVVNIGNSRAMMVISGLRAITLCVSVPLSFDTFGLEGALFAVALAPLASVPFTIYILRPFLGRQLWVDAVWTGIILCLAINFVGL